jgi:peptide/nickel transport system substrate-binding protein
MLLACIAIWENVALKIKNIIAFLGAIFVGTLNVGGVSASDIKAVMSFDVKILDPIWTNSRPTRNHGYMIYDTLFALNEQGEVAPQMIDRYKLSDANKTYTLTLREGLLWHDGLPVTAEDCVASIRRWAAKDALGKKLMAITESMRALDARTFEIRLTQPTGQLLFALAKPSSYAPFMMPKRVAETDPLKQITDYTGSGPFVFKADEWRPGVKAVYVKFDKYKPRDEPASGLAGGKTVNVDRVEWLSMPDPQSQVNALLSGEIDYLEMPLVDLLPLLRADKNVVLTEYNPLGIMLTFRFNHTTKPFDDPKIRQAAWRALNQKDFMAAAVGDPQQYKICKSMYACGTPFETSVGMEGKLASDFEASRRLLKEAGYDGAPVVLIQYSGLGSNIGPVAKSLLERGGFKVDMQVSDIASWVGRQKNRAPAEAGGWSAYMTGPTGIDTINPLVADMMDASCDTAQPGWPCDPELERLRQSFMDAQDPEAQKAVADAAQKRAIEISTHIPIGQFHVPIATRNTVAGVLHAPAPVFWNLTKR